MLTLGGSFPIHTEGWTKIGILAILKVQDLFKNLKKTMDPFFTHVHMYTHICI